MSKRVRALSTFRMPPVVIMLASSPTRLPISNGYCAGQSPGAGNP
jgi:hypothetical protein